MEVIYGPNAANFQITAQKRLLRPVMAQTQGFPHPAYLDPSLRYSSTGASPGFVRVPVNGDTAGATSSGAGGPSPVTYTANTFTLQGSIVPGTVMCKSGYGSGGAGGEYAFVANGANAAVQPWGLLGQWLGGTFDGVGQNSGIAVWQGPDSEYEILAPGWNDSGASTFTSAAGGTQVLMYAGTDGRLTFTSPGGSAIPVARCLDRFAGSRILIQLLV